MQRQRVAYALVVLACISLGLAYFHWRSREAGAVEAELSLAKKSSVDESLATNKDVATILPRGERTVALAAMRQELTPAQAFAAANNVAACTTAMETSQSSELSPEQAKVVQQEFISTLDCQNLDNRYSIYDLAEYAAESGNQQAQLDFPALAAFAFNDEENAADPEMIRKYKDSSRRFLELAAKAGNADALQRLSESYESGRFMSRNPKLAYAYALAYAQKSGSRFAHQRATNLALLNSPADIADAQRIANKL